MSDQSLLWRWPSVTPISLSIWPSSIAPACLFFPGIHVTCSLYSFSPLLKCHHNMILVLALYLKHTRFLPAALFPSLHFWSTLLHSLFLNLWLACLPHQNLNVVFSRAGVFLLFTFSKVENSKWHRIVTQEMLTASQNCEQPCSLQSATSITHWVK